MSRERVPGKAFDNARSAVIRRCNLSRLFISDFKSEISNYKLLVWVVAQSAEHRTVTAAREGSTPFDPPKSLPICDCRLESRCSSRQIGNCKSSELWPRGEAPDCRSGR